MDLMLDIPSVLSCEIIGKWLYLKDVTRLDSAYCHTSKRQILHKSLFQAPQCVVENVVELVVWDRKVYGWEGLNPFDKSAFMWCASRGLKVRDIHFTAMSDCHVLRAYLQVHGHYVNSALCKDDAFDEDESEVGTEDGSEDGTEDDYEDGTEDESENGTEDESEDKSFDAQLQVVIQCCPHLTSLVLRGGFMSQHVIQQIWLLSLQLK